MQFYLFELCKYCAYPLSALKIQVKETWDLLYSVWVILSPFRKLQSSWRRSGLKLERTEYAARNLQWQ